MYDEKCQYENLTKMVIFTNKLEVHMNTTKTTLGTISKMFILCINLF